MGSEQSYDHGADMNAEVSRRKFIKGGLTAGALLVLTSCGTTQRRRPREYVQTVLGPVKPEELGRTLAHEHVMCDFAGASETGRHRWKVEEVVAVMRPHLEALKKRGFGGFVDCTPAYIGRDARVLERLAMDTGLHIVTNTGYYGGAKDKFVPKHAYEESKDRLAARWIGEWKNGIEDTGVRPGFMKIGVDAIGGNSPALSEIDAKLVRAASIASQETGMTAVCHTGGGAAGVAAAKLFISEGGLPGRFAVAHSDGHGIHINQQVADLGAWVSFDAISRKPLEQHLKLVSAMLEKHSDRLLLSHDNGWYEVGKPGGGKVRDFNYIADTFLSALKNSGVAEAVIEKLIISNPARAFAISSIS